MSSALWRRASTTKAKAAFAAKKNLRLLELPKGALELDRELQLKRILGGMLVQRADLGELADNELRTMTKRVPTAEEMHTMRFAWKVSKHVKSNAIVFARDSATLGVGAGQMSRVDSVKIAVMKAQTVAGGSVVASDAFFPFPDGVEEAAKAGATAVIQPGGSVRDDDVICGGGPARFGDGVHRHAALSTLERCTRTDLPFLVGPGCACGLRLRSDHLRLPVAGGQTARRWGTQDDFGGRVASGVYGFWRMRRRTLMRVASQGARRR